MGIRYIGSVRGSVGWIALLGLASSLACSHPNPDFTGDAATGEDAGHTDDPGDGTITSGTSSKPGDDTSVDTSNGVTSMSVTTNGPSSETESTSDASDTTDDPTGNPPACMFAPPYQLSVSPPLNGMNCLIDAQLSAMVLNVVSSTSYMVRQCLTCDCRMGAEYTLTFDLAPPEFMEGDCFSLEVDLANVGDNECFVDAYGLYDVDGAPIQLVSNVAEPDVQDAFSVELAMDPAIVCGEGCDAEMTGHYDLLATGGGPAPPNEVPVPHGGYDLVNSWSGRQGCNDRYRWYATWN